MSSQDAINAVQKLLPLVLDVAAMVPGLNIPVNAVKVINDSLVIEEAAHTWLSGTTAGKEVMSRISDIAENLGLSTTLEKGNIRIETRAQAQFDFNSGHA